ncbi:hypothetical protein [Tomitella gaofuii]|uniref:hypothetical protein n=1 Tax=Tomitella gaofuii TaxID=2760083 RepID=UPI0015FB9461|nr:hypothetical protein [Tomitella gaofuii]
MALLIEKAMTVDVSAAAQTILDAATDEVTRQVRKLIGEGPLPGTPEWEAEAKDGTATDRQLAHDLTSLRIELSASLDPLPTVISLRRIGATWELIARAAGVSRQAAHDRWGRKVLAILDRYGSGELGGPVANDEADLT